MGGILGRMLERPTRTRVRWQCQPGVALLLGGLLGACAKPLSGPRASDGSVVADLPASSERVAEPDLVSTDSRLPEDRMEGADVRWPSLLADTSWTADVPPGGTDGPISRSDVRRADVEVPAVGDASREVAPVPAATMDALADGSTGAETAAELQCAKQTVDSLLYPVSGTVHGPKVDGVVCENGLGTFFLGPNGSGSSSQYNQDFDTTTIFNDSTSPKDYNSPLVYGFLMREPVGVVSADLSGWAGASAAAVDSYASTMNCGRLDFVVRLPIPLGIVCPTEFSPCGSDCEPSGEMEICEPANPQIHYAARSAAYCGTQEAPLGSWRLTLTSVARLPDATGYKQYETHGHLLATLINQADPSDSVDLALDF